MRLLPSSPDFDEINELTVLYAMFVNPHTTFDMFMRDEFDNVFPLPVEEIEEAKAMILERLQALFDFQELGYNDYLK